MKKTIFIGLSLTLAALSVQAQTERRILTKAEQTNSREWEISKQEEAIRDSIAYIQALDALERLDFVLEADQLQFRRGRMAYVSTVTNFISLSDDEATVQIAPYNDGGPNGVGGITLVGRASDIRIKTDKKENTYFSMDVMGTGLSATVDIVLPKGSNRASVTVNPYFHGNRITLYGNLYPSNLSQIFKGRSF